MQQKSGYYIVENLYTQNLSFGFTYLCILFMEFEYPRYIHPHFINRARSNMWFLEHRLLTA